MPNLKRRLLQLEAQPKATRPMQATVLHPPSAEASEEARRTYEQQLQASHAQGAPVILLTLNRNTADI